MSRSRPAPANVLLTVRQASELKGVSKKRLYTAVRNGALPAIHLEVAGRAGRRYTHYLLSLADLAFWTAGRQPIKRRHNAWESLAEFETRCERLRHRRPFQPVKEIS